MEIEWFKDEVDKTRKLLMKQKHLNYGDFIDFVFFENYIPQITEKQARMTRVFLEISCARKVSHHLDNYMGENFGLLLKTLLDIFESNVGKKIPEENPLTFLPDRLFELADHSTSSNCLVETFNNQEISDVDSIKISSAYLALIRVGFDVFLGDLGDVYDLKKWGQTTPKDRLGIPDPYSTNATFEALAACRGWPEQIDIPEAQENNIKFWTWYMDEALPWAIEQTNKKLAAS